MEEAQFAMVVWMVVAGAFSWRVFLDPTTGDIHDGNEYAKTIIPGDR